MKSQHVLRSSNNACLPLSYRRKIPLLYKAQQAPPEQQQAANFKDLQRVSQKRLKPEFIRNNVRTDSPEPQAPVKGVGEETSERAETSPRVLHSKKNYFLNMAKAEQFEKKPIVKEDVVDSPLAAAAAREAPDLFSFSRNEEPVTTAKLGEAAASNDYTTAEDNEVSRAMITQRTFKLASKNETGGESFAVVRATERSNNLDEPKQDRSTMQEIQSPPKASQRSEVKAHETILPTEATRVTPPFGTGLSKVTAQMEVAFGDNGKFEDLLDQAKVQLEQTERIIQRQSLRKKSIEEFQQILNSISQKSLRESDLISIQPSNRALQQLQPAPLSNQQQPLQQQQDSLVHDQDRMPSLESVDRSQMATIQYPPYSLRRSPESILSSPDASTYQLKPKKIIHKNRAKPKTFLSRYVSVKPMVAQNMPSNPRHALLQEAYLDPPPKSQTMNTRRFNLSQVSKSKLKPQSSLLREFLPEIGNRVDLRAYNEVHSNPRAYGDYVSSLKQRFSHKKGSVSQAVNSRQPSSQVSPAGSRGASRVQQKQSQVNFNTIQPPLIPLGFKKNRSQKAQAQKAAKESNQTLSYDRLSRPDYSSRPPSWRERFRPSNQTSDSSALEKDPYNLRAALERRQQKQSISNILGSVKLKKRI